MDIIRAAVGRDLTDDEKDTVHRNAVRILAQARDGSTSVSDLLTQLKDRNTASAIASKRSAIIAQRVAIEKDNLRLNNPAIARNPGDAIVDMIRGGLSGRFGSKASLGSLVKTERETNVAAFNTEIDQAGLTKYFAQGNDDKNLGLAKYWLQHGDADKATVYGKSANDAAKIMIKHNMAAVTDAQTAGIEIHPNPDRITSNSHDPYKIGRAGGNPMGSKASEAEWISSLGKLDWTRSFGGELAGAGPAERANRLSSLYQQLSTGEHLVWNDLVKQAKDRELIWQTPEDEMAYQQKYGLGNTLYEKFISNLGTMGRDTAIAKSWGPTAKANLDKFVDRWKKELTDQGRGQDMAALEKNYNVMMKRDWPIITGDVDRPAGHDGLARFSAAIRTAQPAMKLGSVVLHQVTDLGTRATILNRYGSRSVGGFMEKTATGITNMLGLTGHNLTPEVRGYAARMGILLDSVHMPLSNSSMLEATGMGKMATLDRQLMRWSGSQWWINRMRTNSAAEMGVNHFQLKDKGFDQLPEGVREGFKQYGINPAGWDVLRSTKGFDLGNGSSALDVRDVAELPRSSFRSLATMDDPTDAHLARKQTELSDNYRNYVSDVANMAVNHPSYAVRAIAMMGTEKGTPLGEGVRQASVFKMWTLSYMRNFIGGELHGYAEDRVGNGEAMWRLLTAKDGGRGMTGLATLIAGSVFWGYVSNALRDVSDLKTPQNPLSDAPIQQKQNWLPNPTEGSDALYRAVSTGSTAGLYSDFLLGNAQDFWNQLGEMSGPTFTSLGQGASAAKHITIGLQKYDETGDTTHLSKAGDQMLQLMEQNTPGRNFMYTKAALDYMVLDNLSEALDPGWKQRKQQRLLQQHNQTYLMGGQQ